jgi:transposase InsO family protein
MPCTWPSTSRVAFARLLPDETKANCYDNAAMESFFGTLKCELFHLNKFETTEKLKEALHDYIRYYNVDRIKLALGGLSPVAFRMQAAAALA